MCTVVFIPGKDCNYFASLRDENPERQKAQIPAILGNEELKYLSPVDSLAGGTWIGANELGAVIILLNGAFKNHERRAPYVKSRGLIVSELLQSDVPVIDWSMMDMENVEPYTIIVWVDKMLFQLIWDGEKKHRITLEADKPHIWSSATLYDAGARAKREELFQNWIVMDPPVSKVSLLNFFKQFNDTQNGFLVNRNNKIKTLSYTFIESNIDNKAVLNYYDLQAYSYHTSTINLKSKTSDLSILFNLSNDN